MARKEPLADELGLAPTSDTITEQQDARGDRVDSSIDESVLLER